MGTTSQAKLLEDKNSSSIRGGPVGHLVAITTLYKVKGVSVHFAEQGQPLTALLNQDINYLWTLKKVLPNSLCSGTVVSTVN